MPTRRQRGDRSAITGSIPSQKPTLHMVRYRGLVQRAYIYLLEYDQHVLSYQAQPFSIAYQVHNRLAHYTPDFRIVWSHLPPRLVSCVSDSDEGNPSRRAQWTATQRWCELHHHDFALITKDVLHPQSALLANLEHLAIHAFVPIPPQTYEYVLKAILSIGGPFSPIELIQSTPLVHHLRTKSLIWKLVYNGKLLTDLTQPLNITSTLLIWHGHVHHVPISSPIRHASP